MEAKAFVIRLSFAVLRIADPAPVSKSVEDLVRRREVARSIVPNSNGIQEIEEIIERIIVR